MNKQNILKTFCKDLLVESLEICKQIDLQEPFKEKKEKIYQLKNGLFNKEIKVSNNDYSEFFSRNKVKNSIEKINDFDSITDLISARINVKRTQTKKITYTFIQNYIKDRKNFEFNTEIFNLHFKNLLKFLNDEITQIYYFTPIFNLNFSTKDKQKDFGEMVLRKIDEEKFKIIKEDLVGIYRYPPGYLHTLNCILETKIPFQDNIELEEEQAKQIFEKFLNVSHLFDKGDLKIGKLYRNYTPWQISSSSIPKNFDMNFGENELKINKNSVSDLKKFHIAYSKIKFDKNWSFIKVAIDRFSSSILRNDPIDKIVDLNVALECLFSSAGETSLKITNRTSMLAGDDSDQEDIWNFIKTEYKLRNDILHGRKSRDKISLDQINELKQILRICIRKFLNFSENLSVTDLKKQGKLSNQTVRDYILDELDRGLINREKLDDFLRNANGRFD